MNKFVSVITQGTLAPGADEVVLFIYGPKGGTRAIESLSPAAAYGLGHELIKSAEAITLKEKS